MSLQSLCCLCGLSASGALEFLGANLLSSGHYLHAEMKTTPLWLSAGSISWYHHYIMDL